MLLVRRLVGLKKLLYFRVDLLLVRLAPDRHLARGLGPVLALQHQHACVLVFDHHLQLPVSDGPALPLPGRSPLNSLLLHVKTKPEQILVNPLLRVLLASDRVLKEPSIRRHLRQRLATPLSFVNELLEALVSCDDVSYLGVVVFSRAVALSKDLPSVHLEEVHFYLTVVLEVRCFIHENVRFLLLNLRRLV